MLFFKTTEPHDSDGVVKTITTFIPLESSNSVLRFRHFSSFLYPTQNEEGESIMETSPEFIIVEYPVTEQTYVAVKLKKLKRIKQTKTEEYFDVEMPQPAYQAMFTKVSNPEEVSKLLDYLNNNLV